MTFKIASKHHYYCLLLAILICIPTYNFIRVATDKMFESQIIKYPTSYELINYAVLTLIILVIVTIVHELIHKFFYERFGGRAIIGFKGIYAYTQEISRIAIDSWKFFIILLAPLFIISLLTLPMNNWFTNLVFYVNLVGSTGDILMSAFVLKYGKNAKIIDEKTGFTVVYKSTK